MLNPQQNAMITLLLSSFPNFQSGDAETALAAYSLAISDAHSQDLADAVRAFVQGRVPGHNMAFAPTAPQLASACRRAMEVRLDDANRHRKAVAQIEAREVDTPKNAEMRERVKALTIAAVEQLSMSDEPTPRNNEKVRAAYIAKHDAYFRAPEQFTAADSEDDGDMGGRAAS